MIDTKLRKTPVRWSDADIEKVWEALPAIIEKNRKRGLTWQIEHAGQVALGPDRWKRIPSFANVPSLLLRRIAERYPLLKHVYPQLENVNQIPLDKEAFINLVAEARLTKPFDDFVDIWNDCIAMVPELGLPEVSHSKYIDPDFSKLIQKHCEDLLLPEPEVPPEPEPEPPKLEESKSEDLIKAYHTALVRELRVAVAMAGAVSVKVETNGNHHAVLKEITKETPAKMVPAPKLQTVITNRVTAADADDAESEACGRLKVRVAVVDHNTSRTPTDFERTYATHPRFKFKFMFMQIGATGVPVFKVGGYAIISESAPVSWKQDAIRICTRPNVSVVNGSRESVHDAMQNIIKQLESRPVAKA